MERCLLTLFPVIVCLLHLKHLTATRCSKLNSANINNNIQFNGTTGTIFSPDYSSQAHYPRDIECTWIISGPVGHIVRLTFKAFDLEPESAAACTNKDFVQVRSGFQSTSGLVGDYCGHVGAFSVDTSGRFMWVHFRSDSSTEARGFSASYRTLKPKKKEETESTPVALIVVGVILGLVVIFGVLLAVCNKKIISKSGRGRRADRFIKPKMGSRVSMYPSESALPRSVASLRGLNGRQSRAGSLPTTPSTSKRLFLTHQYSVPQLFVTNEFGVTTDLLPRHKVATEALVHTSPFSKRRFGHRGLRTTVKPLISVVPASPTQPRRGSVDTNKSTHSLISGLGTPDYTGRSKSKIGSPPIKIRGSQESLNNNNKINLS